MRHRPRFTWRELGSVALVALGLSVVPFILIPLAELHITSILASLLNATTPLWTALFVALLIPTEKATRLQIVGLLIGAFGIAVLLGAWNVERLAGAGRCADARGDGLLRTRRHVLAHLAALHQGDADEPQRCADGALRR